MNDYRINKQELLKEIGGWNRFLKRKVHLIACGGTALTLLDLKESTRDIDFIVPHLAEYDYLILSYFLRVDFVEIIGLNNFDYNQL